MGEGLATGLTTGLANLPTWVLFFVVFTIIFLMKPWENIKGIPSWAWIAVGVLAIWSLIQGK